jgi:hypothetical protein
MNKEEAYKIVQDALHQCTVKEAHHCAVVVVVNEKESTVKVYGLNIAEEDVPSLLLEAAGEVAERYMESIDGRTLQ